MVYQRRRSFSRLFILFLSLTTWAVPDPTPGVVVEKVASGSEAEKAGITAGDLVLSWSQGDVKGIIESAFDLSQVELEQGSCGAVVFSGVRNREQRQWTIATGVWGLNVRPILTEPWSAAYQEGRQLAEGGDALGAALGWREAATAQADSPLVAIWFLSQAAGLLSSNKQWEQADSTFEQALQKAASADIFIRGQLLRAWALSYQQRHDWANAEKYFNQALTVYQQPRPQHLNVATLLNDLGNLARTRGDIAAAEKDYQRGLAITQQLAPESLIAAASLHGLGFVAFERGDVAQAEKYYLSALEIREKLAPGTLDLANTLNNLGNVNQEKSNFDEAERLQRRSLQIKQALMPDSLAVANSVHNLGIIEQNRGEFAAAEEDYRRALEIRQRLDPDGPALIDSFGSLGQLAEAREDLSTAENFYRKALILAEKLLPGSLELARIYESQANVAKKNWDFPKAELFYRRALKIKEARAPGGLDSAWTLHNLGSLCGEARQYAKAERYYLQSLAITRKLAPNSSIVTQSFLDLGALASARRQTARAIEYYSEAQAITARIAPKSWVHAQALAGMAEQMRRKYQFQAALRLYAEAINALEDQIAQLGGSEQTRSEFRAGRANYYRDYLDLLMLQGKPDAAFQVLERFRARSLLELLTEAHLNLRNGIDPELMARERSLQQALTRSSNRRIQILTETNDNAQIAASQKEMDDLLIQYQELRDQIRKSSPRYAELTQPHPLGIREVQRLLDDHALFLEYSLGEKRSYLWALTSNTVTTFALPKRTIIERLARTFYGMVSTRSSVHAKQAVLSEGTGAALSNMILGPAAGLLKGKRLLIVSDGALQYIPFAALPSPHTTAKADYEPLMVRHEIISLPSASVLAMLQHDATRHKDNTKMVAVLADPVFDREDVRVQTKPGARPVRLGPDTGRSMSLAAELLTRSAADAGVSRGEQLLLPRLPFSRREALSILSVTPAGQGMAALDFQASRPTAVSPELKQYRIVHFATHGLVDSKHPAFSGLVLSLVDQDGNEQEGFLSLQEIYNLDLPVELVVLSACETALGKEIDGEGLLGLTRGFMYAGAPRVIASLWNINDVATAELMSRFYAAVEEKHMGFAAALRSAQIAMWKQQRWKYPYYWAAFEIQGEWN